MKHNYCQAEICPFMFSLSSEVTLPTAEICPFMLSLSSEVTLPTWSFDTPTKHQRLDRPERQICLSTLGPMFHSRLWLNIKLGILYNFLSRTPSRCVVCLLLVDAWTRLFQSGPKHPAPSQQLFLHICAHSNTKSSVKLLSCDNSTN